MKATVGWQRWDPIGSKHGDREGRGEEPGDMETEVPDLTKERIERRTKTRITEDFENVLQKD